MIGSIAVPNQPALHFFIAQVNLATRGQGLTKRLARFIEIV
jgi:hypothetical protein